jgi:hypothetical protein
VIGGNGLLRDIAQDGVSAAERHQRHLLKNMANEVKTLPGPAKTAMPIVGASHNASQNAATRIVRDLDGRAWSGMASPSRLSPSGPALNLP